MGIIKDAITIGKILSSVIIMFNLDSIRENELKNYAKLYQSEWIEKCKTESEVEQYLITKAKEITKN
ncbi:hypothetical protein ACI3DN_16150 [Sellimonas catena]|uniref:Uncharacterized protein n=1 Tax=Sellimonas catena TaxID=2994035 RepID=A0A9W6CBY0_9FIRM|nr:hypothetical protein [Sellimonas catena]GLG06365.1 hypothetical protein Selli1_35390 [Sellimonas catena]